MLLRLMLLVLLRFVGCLARCFGELICEKGKRLKRIASRVVKYY